MNKLQSAGFTFIELLVSITIITVMMAIATVSFRGANKNARDAKRKADLQEIRGAVETYRLAEGSYPNTNDDSSQAVFMDDLQPTYLSQNFSDPINTSPNLYYYRYVGSASCNYVLYAPVEVSGNAMPCPAACYNAGTDVYCLAN